MESPEISVVLPVWNGGRYLAEAIESIRSQTFVRLELLVIDDGSTDRSRAIAAEHAARDGRIRVIGTEHRGIVAAIHTGLDAARGRYIARMDADDIAAPSRLEKQFAFLEANPSCVAVGSNVQIVDESGAAIGDTSFPQHHHELCAALLTGSSGSFAHSTVLVRKEAIEAAGRYRAELYPSEDFDLWLRLMNIGELANLGEQLLRYRRHPNAVGVRERQRQIATGTVLINAARLQRGLAPLPDPLAASTPATTALYHDDCARIALKAGKRLAAIRHAVASIACAPFRLEPYAALAACALPRRALVQAYALLRAVAN